jgi:hypothetical protein
MIQTNQQPRRSALNLTQKIKQFTVVKQGIKFLQTLPNGFYSRRTVGRADRLKAGLPLFVAAVVFGATPWEYRRVNALAGASLGGALFWDLPTSRHTSPLPQLCTVFPAAF